MKHWLSTALFVLFFHGAWSQIVITGSDMPVHGDTLRYSSTDLLSTVVNAADSGVGMTWVYDLTPTSQGLDEYKKPGEVSPLYSLSLPPNCYGYKVADSIPGISLIASGITIKNMYNFFDGFIAPDAWAACAFGAQISGFPLGANYISPDVWYRFPLTYDMNDSNDFYLKFGLASFGSIKMKGYRKNRVDGWGDIFTPYFLTPTHCIRIRSEIVEVDSVTFDSTSFGIPRTTIEYKYLVKGEHYPAVWATANVIGGVEIMTTIKYKDIYRYELDPNPGTITGVGNAAGSEQEVKAFPNPTVNGRTTLQLPQSWKSFYAELFDAQSRSVGIYKNTKELDLSALPAGNYLARVISGNSTAYVKITK